VRNLSGVEPGYELDSRIPHNCCIAEWKWKALRGDNDDPRPESTNKPTFSQRPSSRVSSHRGRVDYQIIPSKQSTKCDTAAKEAQTALKDAGSNDTAISSDHHSPTFDTHPSTALSSTSTQHLHHTLRLLPLGIWPVHPVSRSNPTRPRWTRTQGH